jgi:hypothetical protein
MALTMSFPWGANITFYRNNSNVNTHIKYDDYIRHYIMEGDSIENNLTSIYNNFDNICEEYDKTHDILNIDKNVIEKAKI